MKTLFALMIFSSVFISTDAIANKPEKIARKFLEAMCNGDYMEAAKYCTSQTRGYAEKLSIEKKLPVEPLKTIEIMSSDKTRASAEIKYLVSDETEFRKLNLVKFKDGWQVQLDINAMKWCIQQ